MTGLGLLLGIQSSSTKKMNFYSHKIYGHGADVRYLEPKLMVEIRDTGTIIDKAEVTAMIMRLFGKDYWPEVKLNFSKTLQRGTKMSVQAAAVFRQNTHLRIGWVSNCQ